MAALLWALLGVAAGAGVAIQGPINARLAANLGAPMVAALISFVAGGVLLAIIATATTASSNASIAWRAPPAWLFLVGGCFGATYVTAAIFLTPRIGAGALSALAIAGQLIAGLILDRIGFLGIPMHALTPGRIAGAVLLVIGTVMVRFL